MRKRKQQSPVWPYLIILAFLFVLSLASPRAWDRKARRDLVKELSRPQTAAIEVEASFDFEPPDADDAPVFEMRETEPVLPEDEDEPLLDMPVVPEVVRELEPALSEPELEPQVVPPAPLFAEEVREPVEESASEPEVEIEVVEVEPAPPAEPAAPVYAWPLPRVLLAQLTELSERSPRMAWPQRAIEGVHELCLDDTDPGRTTRLIASLRGLVEVEASQPPDDPALEPSIARARYALTRWLDVWQAVVQLSEIPLSERVATTSPERVMQCLATFHALADGHAAGSAWREYLELDALARIAAHSQDDSQRRATAQKVLDRMASRQLSAEQRKFINEGPLAELRDELRGWAAEEVTAARLMDNLERYENSALPSDARQVAIDYRGLNWSAPDEAERLSGRLNSHYRNANLRIAVSGDLLNRMIPQPEPIAVPVRDIVVNVPVRGHSNTFTELSVKLVPDPRRIRFGLEARGVVDSDTVATSGPATFRNNGQSTFLVRKLFVLGPSGLSVWPAIAEAENNYNYLVSLETNFDGVPLVGSLVRTIARNQHDEMRVEASQEATAKVAIRALQQFDSEAEDRLREAGENLDKKQLATLRRLGLELTPVALSTTDQRVVARARLASPEQLGAHSPRPRAPSDSWFSLQLHQSALNNALMQLDLDGRSFELPELFAWVAEKLDRPELTQLEELPEDVQLTFAAKDAVRLNCQDGRVEVYFAIAELRHEGSRWHDFEVHTTYVPEVDGLSPRFVREDTIHLGGRSVRGKIEIKLRAIFSRVMSKNRPLALLGNSLTGDPKLQELEVTQFDIQDGWIALAYSPRRRSTSKVANRPE